MTERPRRLGRIALVVPYCGGTVYGGASALALAVARRLSPSFELTVLTTCALDYETWRNAVPAGHERIGGVHVRRFPVDRERDRRAFERLSRELIYAEEPGLEAQEEWMRAQGPCSSALLDHLDTFGTRYDAVLFFTYLYATTYLGLPIVEDRAILVPLAHDEWPLRFPMWDRFFARPSAFVFSSEEERQTVRGRFPALGIDGPIAGIGLEPPGDVSAERFRERTGIDGPFALYLGRIDPSKGCEELLEDFARFRATASRPLRLVLAGERHMALPPAADVIALGTLDEQTKWDALAACDVFVMPSPYESLSIAVLEAWTQARPVLVNGRCRTLVGQCRRAGGGLWYASAEEFAVGLELLQNGTARALGESGRRYVAAHYTWQHVDAVYHGALARFVPPA